MNAGPRRVLVLQLKRIGDLVLTIPALHRLRSEWPEAEVTVMVEKCSAGLAEALPAQKVLVRGGRGFWKPVAGGGDLCLDFTGSDRSALLAFLSRAARRVTFSRFQRRPLRRWIYTDFVDSSVRDRHTVDHYCDLLGGIGIETAPGGGMATPSGAKPLLEAKGITGPYAVIHAGTAREEKFWEASRWAEVAEALMTRHGLPVVLTGSSDPREQSHIAEIMKQCPDCRNLCGTGGLIELASIVGGARIFCGVDTAAMHMADAQDVPVVALFGPTNPFHWGPRGSHSQVLRSRTVEPFTPHQKGGPMREITSEAVQDAVGRLLPFPQSSNSL